MNCKHLLDKIDFLYCLLLTVLSFLTLYFFSQSTSPIGFYACFDQNIFNIIGKSWAEGGLPYISVWDSKGPWIFFVNMLGYKLTGNVFGVFIIEVINLAATLIVAFYMLSQYLDKLKSLLVILVYLASYIFISSYGNQVGEYSMLLSVIAILFAWKWSYNWNRGEASHPWKYTIAYGLFFGLSLLSRATNAMPIIIIYAIIFCVLIYNKLWKNLIENILAFILGFAIVFVPFAIYFAIHGAFGEMWYATISYNIEYMLHSNISETMTAVDHYPIYFCLNFICLISAFVYAIVELVSDKRNLRFNTFWIIVSGVTLAWLLNSYGNANYAITYLPIIFIPFVNEANRKSNGLEKTVVALTAIIAFISFANKIRIDRAQIQTYNEVQTQINMINAVPKNDTFIAYNCQPYIYISTNRKPCYRYFVAQDWAIQNGPSLRKKVISQFSTLKAQWILVHKEDTLNISNILNQSYEVVGNDNKHNLKLYKRK